MRYQLTPISVPFTAVPENVAFTADYPFRLVSIDGVGLLNDEPCAARYVPVSAQNGVRVSDVWIAPDMLVVADMLAFPLAQPDTIRVALLPVACAADAGSAVVVWVLHEPARCPAITLVPA